MKIRLCLAFTLALGALASAHAYSEKDGDKGSAGFNQLKSLVGLWEGEMPAKEVKGDASGEPADGMKMTVEYRLTAGGSVLQETTNARTPMEMVTMYHNSPGGLSLTHYCMLGNQPRMDYTGTRDGALQFTLSKDSDLDPGKDQFMNSLALAIVDADHLVHRWTMYQNGQIQQQDIHFTRVK